MAERRAELYEFLEKYLGCMKENAVRMMDEPMPEADEELFSLFEKTGNRLRYEEVYFLRRKYLAVFGCLSILDGGEAYVKKLAGVLRGICGEECWALPAHVHRDTDPDWRICVDLFASETAQALAEIVSLAGERLPEDVRRLVRENVFHRVLEPFANRKPPYPPWEGAGHNWNAVCAGSIGCAAICLMREEPERLEPLLERLLIWRAFPGMGPAWRDWTILPMALAITWPLRICCTVIPVERRIFLRRKTVTGSPCSSRNAISRPGGRSVFRMGAAEVDIRWA